MVVQLYLILTPLEDILKSVNGFPEPYVAKLKMQYEMLRIDLQKIYKNKLSSSCCEIIELTDTTAKVKIYMELNRGSNPDKPFDDVMSKLLGGDSSSKDFRSMFWRIYTNLPEYVEDIPL